jgi:hypothetical protein
VIRPPTAPTAPPTAAPRAAPCPPAAAAPIAAPLPAPMSPPPIVRWTGSYGLVQADEANANPTISTRGEICRLVATFMISAPPRVEPVAPNQERQRPEVHPKKARITTTFSCVIFRTYAHSVHGEDYCTLAGFGATLHGTLSRAPKIGLMHREVVPPDAAAASRIWDKGTCRHGTNLAADSLYSGVEAPVWEESKDARSRIGAGGRTCRHRLAGCARCAAGVEYGAT